MKQEHRNRVFHDFRNGASLNAIACGRGSCCWEQHHDDAWKLRLLIDRSFLFWGGFFLCSPPTHTQARVATWYARICSLEGLISNP